MTKALVVGGTGPTGPVIVAGLEARGHDVTVCHTGNHEVDEVLHLPHIHCDVRDRDSLTEAIGSKDWNVAVVTYGRLRTVAEVLKGRVGHFVSVGGGPALRGYFDPWAFDPPGLPLPTPEDAPTSWCGRPRPVTASATPAPARATNAPTPASNVAVVIQECV